MDDDEALDDLVMLAAFGAWLTVALLLYFQSP